MTEEEKERKERKTRGIGIDVLPVGAAPLSSVSGEEKIGEKDRREG